MKRFVFGVLAAATLFSAGRVYLRTTVVGDYVYDLRAGLCKLKDRILHGACRGDTDDRQDISEFLDLFYNSRERFFFLIFFLYCISL